MRQITVYKLFSLGTNQEESSNSDIFAATAPKAVQHSPSKCLAWVKKCCHVWLDQNFDPSLLTNKLWLIFMGKKQKKIQNGRLKKSAFFKIANSQNFFVKISWIGPWVSRIEWCEGHWCSSMYMVVRLSDISSKMA